jgi:Zn-dependent membrane protease YugP
MDQAEVIAEIAKRNGVILDPDDPVLVINTMLDIHAKPPPVVLTDAQVKEIGLHLARGSQAWAAGMIQAAHRQHYVIMLATILAAVALGGLSAWWIFGMPIVATPVRIATGLGIMLLSGVVGYGIATTTLKPQR